MFCQNCGKEIQKEWAVCPNCGYKVSEKENELQEDKEYNLFGIRRTGRATLWRIYTTIEVSGEDIHIIITQGKKTEERKFKKEEIMGIDFPILPIWRPSDIFRIVVFALLLPVSHGLSIFAILFSVKIAVSRHLRLKLNSGQVIKIPICQKADASDFLRELDYPAEEIEKNDLKRVTDKKWGMKQTVIHLSLLFVAGLALYIGIAMNMENTQEKQVPEEKKEVVEEKKVIDYSDADLEEFVGQSETMLEETDFIYDEENIDYQLLDGDVIVECTDKKIHMIMIEGDGEFTPNFHGVKIGMTIEEAEQLLADKYEGAGGTEDKRVYVDLDSGISVGFSLNDNIINGINAMQLTEDEIQEYMQEEFIFPDSDKRYLSEEEVRSATIEELFIGRNEIFARHGYIFEDEGLKQHFGSTSWYQEAVSGDQFNADEEFNDFEKKNVGLIKKIEDEINGTEQMNAEQQQKINEAYNFLLGHSFHLQNSQPLMEFQSSEMIRYCWGGEIPDDYYNYSITARYEVYKDDLKEWLTFITIDGEEYYLRYSTDGSINLTSMSGNGLLDGWYEMYS